MPNHASVSIKSKQKNNQYQEYKAQDHDKKPLLAAGTKSKDLTPMKDYY